MAGKSDLYGFFRRQYHDVSGNTSVAVADTATVTLVTGKTGRTVFVQRILVVIITSAAQTLTFKDSAGTPKQLEATDSDPGANTIYEWDFGAEGIPLTEAKNLVMAISGAGLVANVAWEGYLRQTAVGYLSSTTTGGPAF